MGLGVGAMATFLDYDFAPEPHQIHEIYESGFQGVRPDPVAYAALRRVVPRFSQAFPEATGRGKGRASLPYKSVLSKEPEFGRYESQTTGDCVSHSTRNAGMLDYCLDALFGETKYEGRLATEPIYGYRGHGGQGASCARLATYVSQRGPGGFLVRKEYSAGGRSVDLSRYNSRIGHNWGRSGTPSWLNEIADDNKALRVMNVKSISEAIDALACGFGISMCSGLGFSSRRDENGIGEQRGSWAHAMAWIGVDDTDRAHQIAGGPMFLVQNSWGQWNSGPKRHDQPDGSFWIRPKVAERMLRGGGGWVIASVRGFDRELVYDRASQLIEGR